MRNRVMKIVLAVLVLGFSVDAALVSWSYRRLASFAAHSLPLEVNREDVRQTAVRSGFCVFELNYGTSISDPVRFPFWPRPGVEAAFSEENRLLWWKIKW
jgi:hypothetical protein